MKVHKSLRPVLAYARDHGFQVDRTAGGHLRIHRPGCPPVFSASTPSDHRGVRNTLARLRRLESTGGTTCH